MIYQITQVKYFRFISFLIIFIILWNLQEISDLGVSAYKTSSKVEIRTDGTLMINQKPFFPFGLYHVSWDSTDAEQIQHLQEIADAGFNLVHASAPRWDSYGRFLNKAAQLGVYVISEQNSGSLLDFVNRFKNKPAVLGWKLADDVDIYKNGKGYVPAEILKLHHEVKTVDPDHITYIAGAIDKRISEFVNTADAIGATAYPIGHEENQPIHWAYHIVSIVDNVRLEKHFTTAALQAFRWPHQAAPLPTVSEIRNLTYQSIVAGAKGIIYYTYYDEAWNLAQYPVLWKGLKSLILEIKEIESLLLNGKRSEISTGFKNVKSHLWKFEHQGLIIIVNMSYKKIKNIYFEIPKNIKNVTQLFQNNSSSIVFKENKIYGSAYPLDISVFRFTDSVK